MVERLALGTASAQRLVPATNRLLMHVGKLRHPKDGGAGPVDSRQYGRVIFVAEPEGARCLGGAARDALIRHVALSSPVAGVRGAMIAGGPLASLRARRR